MSMHITVNLSAGAKSEIQTECMEGGRSRGEHNFKSKDKGSVIFYQEGGGS